MNVIFEQIHKNCARRFLSELLAIDHDFAPSTKRLQTEFSLKVTLFEEIKRTNVDFHDLEILFECKNDRVYTDDAFCVVTAVFRKKERNVVFDNSF